MIRASQLLFTRLEPGYSPRRTAGYQTWYTSADLAPGETKEIEQRIQCYWPAGPADRRLQCFTLASGRVVLGHSVAVMADEEINDRQGRGLIFLAHCLVLSRKTFDECENNPFAILDSFPFYTSVRDVLKAIGPVGSEAPQAEHVLRRYGGSMVSAGPWGGEEMTKLLSLALQARQLTGQRRSLLVMGSPDAIAMTLRLAIWLTPPGERLYCSFDTAVDRCPTPQGQYWAVGLPARQGGGYIEVDAEGGRVVSSVATSAPGHDLYLRSLRAWARRSQAAEIVDRVPDLQRMALLLSEGGSTNVGTIDEEVRKEVRREFVTLHRELFERKFLGAFEPVVGKEAATQLLRHADASPDDDRILLEIAIDGSAQSPRAVELITDWILSDVPTLRDAEWRRLCDLGGRCRAWRLRYLSAALADKPDESTREEALSRLTQTDFARVATLLPRRLAPADLVSRQHIEALLARIDRVPMEGAACVELCKALARHGLARYLDAPQLRRHLDTLDSREAGQVLKVVERDTSVPQAVLDVLQARQQPGLVARLIQWGKDARG